MFAGPPDKPDEGCFPAAALATTPAGLVTMSSLKIGDAVLAATAGGQLAFERIFAFNDINENVQGRFVNLDVQAEGFSRTLQLTPNHFIVAQHAATSGSSPACSAGKILSAAEVHVGDTVWIAIDSKISHASAAHVVGIRSSNEKGFYSPQVRSGTIVVNGVVAATFTTAMYSRLVWQTAMMFVQAWQFVQQSSVAISRLVYASSAGQVGYSAL